MKQKNLLKAFAMMMFVFWSFPAIADIKIGYIDMQKAIQGTTAGKKAKESLEREFNKKKKELEKVEVDLKKRTEDLKKKESVLSDEVLAQKQNELQGEMLKYRETVGKSQMEIQKQERDLTEPILKKLKTAIEKVAQQDGYSVILEKSEQSVIWAKSDLDLTAKVIKEFEKIKE